MDNMKWIIIGAICLSTIGLIFQVVGLVLTLAIY